MQKTAYVASSLAWFLDRLGELGWYIFSDISVAPTFFQFPIVKHGEDEDSSVIFYLSVETPAMDSQCWQTLGTTVRDVEGSIVDNTTFRSFLDNY